MSAFHHCVHVPELTNFTVLCTWRICNASQFNSMPYLLCQLSVSCRSPTLTQPEVKIPILTGKLSICIGHQQLKSNNQFTWPVSKASDSSTVLSKARSTATSTAVLIYQVDKYMNLLDIQESVETSGQTSGQPLDLVCLLLHPLWPKLPIYTANTLEAQ